MTAQAVSTAIPAVRARDGVFLGFGTMLRKELTEWSRGRAIFVIAAISIIGAIFTTLVPFLTPSGQGLELSMDPTANVLLGWGGMTAAVVALVATMGLLSVERDRGTLAWTLSKPVSRISVVAAKWTAATVVYIFLGVLIPLTVSAAVATVAYGAVPQLGTVATFAVLYLTVPAFFIAVMVAVGTFVKTTGGVAGVGFAVLLVPVVLGGIIPIVRELSPTSIGTWALAVATGAPASTVTLVSWIVSMVALAITAAVVFNREEV